MKTLTTIVTTTQATLRLIKDTKGLRYRVGTKLMKEYGNVGLNWGDVAVNSLMSRAALKHEIEAALAATTLASYLPSNRTTLSGIAQFSSTGGTDPVSTIQIGKDAVSSQIGFEPNVGVVNQDVYSALWTRYSNAFKSSEGVVRGSLSEDMLANILGLDRLLVCRAIVKRNGTKQRVFGKHMVLAYVRPEALNADRIAYKIDGTINAFSPNFGYTYVMQGNPEVMSPWFDNNRSAMVYDLDFDRVVANVGTDDAGLINHGYFIQNAVA
jgi:hypothetical protein